MEFLSKHSSLDVGSRNWTYWSARNALPAQPMMKKMPNMAVFTVRYLLVAAIIVGILRPYFVPNLGTFYLVPTIGTMRKTLNSPEYKKLAAWLKEQREASGLNMRELAAKLETTHSFVGKVEQRERKLDVIEFLQYCEALKVSPIEGLRVVNKKL